MERLDPRRAGGDDEIRRLLGRVEESAQRVIDREQRLVGPLRAETETVLRRVAERLGLEDEERPSGDAAARRLRARRAQRELVGLALAQVQDQDRPATVIAAKLLELIGTLRRRLNEEGSGSSSAGSDRPASPRGRFASR